MDVFRRTTTLLFSFESVLAGYRVNACLSVGKLEQIFLSRFSACHVGKVLE